MKSKTAQQPENQYCDPSKPFLDVECFHIPSNVSFLIPIRLERLRPIFCARNHQKSDPIVKENEGILGRFLPKTGVNWVTSDEDWVTFVWKRPNLGGEAGSAIKSSGTAVIPGTSRPAVLV